MPLPEESIQQQGEVLAAQREPGFETENLPSPSGFQVAPIPIPGTGLTEGNNGVGAYLANFNASILKTQDKLTPGKLPEYQASAVFNPRYNSILPGEDSEEAFAQGQSAWKKWGNAMVKMGATAVGTFWNGMTAIPDTVSSINSGTPYDTSAGNAIDKWLKNLEDQFPNYYTHWEQKHPLMASLPFSGGFNNFWGDKFFKNLGFTVGAIGGAVVQDLAIGALTDGIGAIPGVAAQVGKAALWLNKIFTGADKVEELLQLGRAAGRSGEQLMQLKNLSRNAAALKIANGTEYALALYGAAASEAGFEARDGYNKTRQDLIESYEKQNGYSPIGDDLDEIEKYARAAGNVRFGINLALLSVSDAIQFDSFLKPFNAAKAGYKSTLQKALADGSDVAIKESAIDTVEKVTPDSLIGKAWSKVKPIVPSILAEGVYEEGGQYAAQIGTENYYERKYKYDKGIDTKGYTSDDTPWDAKDQINNILHSTVAGLGSEFGTNEGLENVFLGALTGAITGGVQSFLDRGESAKHSASVLSLLNSQGVTGTIQNNYDNTVSAHRISEDMKQAVKNNDIFKYKNFQHEQFVNFILSGLKAGRFDVRMEQLDMLKDMDNDAFKKAFGIDKTTENVKTVNEYVEKLKGKANEIKRTYDLIDEAFRNPFKFNRKAKTDEDSLENEKHLQFEEWKGHLTFLSSITPDVNNRIAAIDDQIRRISPNISAGEVAALTNYQSLKNYSADLAQQIKLAEQGLKDATGTEKKEETKKLNDLKKMKQQLDSATPDNYEKVFDSLLHFRLNGETSDRNITVPQAAIPALIEYGKDVNRLDTYKKSAYDAFEILSSKKGFDDYFKGLKKAQEEEQNKPEKKVEQKAEQKPTPATEKKPSTPSETPISNQVTVKTPQGTAQVFDKDKYYYVPLAKGEAPEKAKVLGKTATGVMVEKEDGTKVDVPDEVFFATDDYGKEIDKMVDNTTSTTDTPPNIGQVDTMRGESKKDLSFGPAATTDPPYDLKTTPDNNFQRRHQNFLFNMGSTDPKVFNQKNKPKIRIIPVTHNTQALLGFPADWIADTTDNADKSPIRAVYVIDDRGGVGKNKGIFYVDEKGNRLSKIGEPIDPNNAIYSNFSSTDLMFGEEPRYTNKENLNPKAVQAAWKNKRKELLSAKSLEDITGPYEFYVSRGIPNQVSSTQNNPVTITGLISKSDLDGPVITVITGGNIAVSGALNNDGQGIAAHKTSVNMGDAGKVVLNHGGNLVYLNSRNFTPSEASNIFDLLKLVADRKFDRSEKGAIFKYLNKIIYMANTRKGGKVSPSSITIEGSNLFLGTSKTPIILTNQSLEDNKDRIISYLTDPKTFHAVNNTELLRIAKNPRASDLEFTELKVKDGKLERGDTWKNYNYYLLNSTNPPLTTHIIKPQEGESPIIQKYSVIKDFGIESSNIAPEAPVSAPVPSPTPKPAPAAKKDKEQGVKQKEELQWVELDTPSGVYKLTFKDEVRDKAGNITDLTPVGMVSPDGKETPFGNPIQAKSILMEALNKSKLSEEPKGDEGLGGEAIDGGEDEPQYRMVFPPVMTYKIADLEEEFKEFRRILPDKYTLNKVDHLLKTTGGGLAWGAVYGAAVYIYDRAEVGTTYHEAFEIVWNAFLDPKEQRDLYDEFTKRDGTFRKGGKDIEFQDASVKDAKEQMAEEFRDFKLTGKLPNQQKQRNFFQRLWDFIKRIFLGNPADLNNLFKKINSRYYKNYSNNVRNISDPQYREVELQQFSEGFIQDMIQGMTVQFFLDVFKENSDIIEQLEENREIAVKNVYDSLKEKLDFYFENSTASKGTLRALFKPKYDSLTSDAEKNIVVEQVRSIREDWRKVKDAWPAFVKEHERYMRIFNMEYEVDDEGNISLLEDDVDESENKSQTEYDRDMMKHDAKNAASTRVKLTIATIADSVWEEATKASLAAARSNNITMKRDNSRFTLPKQVQYAKLFNYLLHNVTNINNIYDIYNRLKVMTDPDNRKPIDANVQRLMNRVDFEKGFEGKTVAKAKLILSLENTLSKQKPAFFRQFVDAQRNTFFKTSVLNSKLNQIKASWIAGIRGSGAVREQKDKFVFSKSVMGIADNLKFLSTLGIDIPKEDYNRLRGRDITRFNEAVNKIRDIVEKAARDRREIPIISSKQLDFDSRLNDLAELYITNMVGEDTQSQHPNLDNEQTSNFVLNNFVSTVVADANNSFTKDEFIDKIDNQYFKDIFHQDSILLTKVLFDENGVKNREVQVGVVEGRESWDRNNRSTPALTEAERQLYEVNNNLNGVYYTLVPADAKTEWALYTGTYLSPEAFFGDESTRANEVTKFANQMYKWLQTEVDLARDYENRKHIVNLNRKDEGRIVGKSLRFFKDILPKEVVDKIHTQVVDGNSNLADIVNATQMRAYMVDFAMSKAQATLDNLVDWNIFQYADKVGMYTLNGVDKAFMENYVSRRDRITESEALRLMGFREMNYILSNIEMHKFLFGDPAQYKDELKRIKSFLSGRENSHVDILGTSEGFNQWANAELNKVGDVLLQPTDPGYHQFKNHFNTFTVHDVEFESTSLKEIQSAIGDKAKPYERGNEADAQTWMTASAYREAAFKNGGSFTQQQEDQFQWEMAWERREKAIEGTYTYSSKALEEQDERTLENEPDNNVEFPILKLVHSGIQFDNDIAIVSLDKASWAPLFYRWYKGRGLGELYNEMQKRGTDYVRMESSHKVGIQTPSYTSLYDPEGKINVEGIRAMKDEAISLKHLGVQVQQSPKKGKRQTEGSQLRKSISGDLRKNGVPLDYKAYGSDQANYTAWNALSEEQKREQSSIYSKIKRHDDALVRMVNYRTDQKMRQLGIFQDASGNFIIEDKKKVSDFILSELERRELPRNIAYGLDIVNNPATGQGEFSQPLEANAQYTKIRSIIYSVIEDTIVRPKVNGGQKTMLSTTGMEKGSRIAKKEVNGKPVYTSNELKFYTKGKDGTEACEVMLPYWFGKSLIQAGSGRTKEEVIKYLNETEEGQKLLRGIGFRIPTQGLNSVDFFIVKEFLPEQMGSVIVLPSEITVKAGSDFDIDKLNTYIRNFYIDKQTGFPKLVKWQGDEEKTKEYIENLLKEGSLLTKKQQDELDSNLANEGIDMTDAAGKVFMSIPGMEDVFSPESITKEFLAKYRSAIIDTYYTKALENEFFDSVEGLLSLPENYSKLVTPNDASDLKELRDDIKKLKGETQYEKNLGTYGRLVDSNFMIKERQAYMASKGIVGISAVSQTAHAVAQNLNGGLLINDPSIVFRFPHETIDGKPSLSGMYIAGTDKLISNINSQTTDGGVDVSKDKFLAEMNINRDTLSTFLMLVRGGASEQWAALYLNQPAIQSFLKHKAINNSVSQLNPSVSRKPDWKTLNIVYREYGGVGKNKARIENKPVFYDIKDMKQMIKDHAEGKKFTPDQQILQLMMLDDFTRFDSRDRKYKGYNSLAWDLFHFYQGYNWDTARLNDPNAARLKEIKFSKANNLMVSPVSLVMNNTFIGAMKDNILRLIDALNSLINVQTGAAGELLDDVAQDLMDQKGLSEDLRRSLLLATELSMVDYVVQTNSKIAGKPLNQYIFATLLGEKAVATYIKALQTSTDKTLISNPFIKNLLAIIDSRVGYPSIVKMIDRDYDTYTSNIWTDAFRELKDNNTVISINSNKEDDRSVAQIYKNLVLATILQFGSRKSSASMTHLIPNETYSEFTRDTLRNMNLEGFYENGVIYRVNWDNNFLVPMAEVEEDPQDPGVYRHFFLKKPAFIDQIKRLLNTESVPQLLNVEAWRYRDKKAIKIITYQREKGEVVKRNVQLFRRVDTVGINGPEPLSVSRKRILFKQINAWGDGGNIQEYHEAANPSILPDHEKVNEIDDETLIYALHKSGVITNTDPTALYNIIVGFEGENPDMDDTGNSTPDTPGPDDDLGPSGAVAEPEFEEIETTDWKKASKKAKFKGREGDNMIDYEGYEITISKHPNLKLFIAKDQDGFWQLFDQKTGLTIPTANASKNTISAVVEEGIKMTNSAMKNPVNRKVLTNLGVATKEEEPDQDIEECNTGKFTIKNKK